MTPEGLLATFTYEERAKAEERLGITHVDGVAWHEAPIPRRLHRCKPQTRGYVRFELMERCACGAVRFDGHGWWIERNQRRKRRRNAR